MPNFTKKAIKDAFLKLLGERPLKQISVRAIVEECGINRNSFYYHFRDIPALIDEMLKDAADSLIEKYPCITSVSDAIEAGFSFALEHKAAALHICNSVNRDIYERYLMHICEYVVSTYFDTVFFDVSISPDDREAIILFVKCELFGLCIDWVNSGMQEESIIKLRHIINVCHGLIRDMTERCKNK